MYRKLPRNQKKSWESFRKSVVVCLSKVNIKMYLKISREGVRLHAWLSSPSLGSRTQNLREEVKRFERNEKIQKIYRSHRDTLTFSGEFISHVMRECINVNG
jgi:glutamate synthase domain-containing protein 2